jgi:penicillin amidase
MPGNAGPFWTEFIPMAHVPFLIDPPRGYVWATNSDPVGNTFDNDPGNDPLYFGFAYALGDRGQRLDDLLGGLTRRGGVTMPELEAVEVDQYSLFAEKLIPYFADALTRGAYPLPPELEPYADAVTAWDRRAVPTSYAATIFYTWAYQFVAYMMIDDYLILDEVSGSNMPYMVPALFHWLAETRPILAGIDAGTTPFPSKSGKNYFDNRETKGRVETRDELIIEALRKAVAHLKQTFAAHTNGDEAADPNDLTTWQWKRMLYLRTRHTLADVDESWQKYDQYRGIGGNVDTVNVAQFTGWEKDKGLRDRYTVGNAPSNRFFWRMEPGGIKAKFQVPWGQSEDPESKHYSDLIDDYVNFKFRDFAYTDAEIAAVTESKRTLK